MDSFDPIYELVAAKAAVFVGRVVKLESLRHGWRKPLQMRIAAFEIAPSMPKARVDLLQQSDEQQLWYIAVYS